jgi:hypothetical protein
MHRHCTRKQTFLNQNNVRYYQNLSHRLRYDEKTIQNQPQRGEKIVQIHAQRRKEKSQRLNLKKKHIS